MKQIVWLGDLYCNQFAQEGLKFYNTGTQKVLQEK